MDYKQQLISLLENIKFNESDYAISDPREPDDTFSFSIPVSDKDDFVQSIQPYFYKYYNYFSGNTAVINNLEKKNKRLWFPEIHQQIIQKDAYWELESQESNGWVVARKNSERARIPAKSYIEVANLEFAGESSTFINIITSRDIKVSDTDNDKVSFYQVYGSKILKDDATNDTIRFYFNLKLNKKLIREWKYSLMNALNSRQIPFNLKYLSDLKFYDRCDAGVLYVQKQNFHLVLPIIIQVYLKLFKFLDEQVPFEDATPLFTKKILAGIGFAESPNVRNTSFGVNVTSIIAEGVYTYLAQLPPINQFNPTECANFIIKNSFNAKLDTPFLNLDDSYIYNFNDIDLIDDKNDTNKLLAYLNTNRYYKKYITDEKNKFLDAAIYFVNILKEKQIAINNDKHSWISVQPKTDESETTKFGLISEAERSWVQYVIDQVEQYPKPIDIPESTDGLNIEGFQKQWSDKFLNKMSEYNWYNQIKEKIDTRQNAPSSTSYFNKAMAYVQNFYKEKTTIGTIKKEQTKKLFFDANNILERIIEINFPYPNKFDNWEFCPTIINGLSQIAYFFLYVHNIKQYYKIDLKLSPAVNSNVADSD